MNTKFVINSNNTILFVVSFFLYSGYYAGLEVMISLGLKEYSRYYSVPVRLIVSFAIIYFLFKNINRKITKPTLVITLMMLMFFSYYVLMIILNIGGQEYMLAKSEYIYYVISWSLLVFLYFANIDLSKKELIIKYFIYAGLIMGGLSFILYKDYFFGGVGRISQLMYEGNDNFISPLVLSYASVISFITYFCYIKEYKNKSGILNLYAFMMLLFAIPMFVLGASRGSFVAFILCFIYIWFFSNLKVKITSLIFFPFFVYLVYWITNITGNNAFERFFSIKSDLDSNSSSTSRLDLWSRAWEYFIQNPLFGGYLEVDGIYPHNIFFELLMNVGVFGFILFLVPLIYLSYFSLIYLNIKQGYFIPLLLVLGVSMHLFSGAVYFAPILFAALGLILNQVEYLNRGSNVSRGHM